MQSLVLFLAVLLAGIQVICSYTDPGDSAALQSLKATWQNTQPSWEKDDPCGAPWDGVTCNDSRVSALSLSTRNIAGSLSGNIGSPTELISLDLSFNRELTGPLVPQLGDLQKLTTLILAGCGFTGEIPDELSKLSNPVFLALISDNYFVGSLPPSLGKLSQLFWLDLAGNQFSGTIPVSTDSAPGLDLLLDAKHFRLNKNLFSGSIPEKLFSADMKLTHLVLDNNQLSGPIPSTLGLVLTLEVLRLDNNSFSGEVPASLNNLVNVIELNLAYNSLTGLFPDLSKMESHTFVDLSNNYFSPTDVPDWLSNLPWLSTLIVENGSLQGPLPKELFSSPELPFVKLRNNAINGTLNMSSNISRNLELANLRYNQISLVETNSSEYANTLVLLGNPVSNNSLANTSYCQPPQQPATSNYSTSLAHCGNNSCPHNQMLSPQSCNCAFPYQGKLYFKAPSFREINVTLFQDLEESLRTGLDLAPHSVFLENPFFNIDNYLEVQVALFPSPGNQFNGSEITRIGLDLSSQICKPPQQLGPY
ncbi:leucine-rich repeat receptor protein kinase HPCA1-like [Syzygium oleosum]|uniref:leucine-rich repeat receptor protein kinase HPCA1-like n=1 Tax=Syzygium oleosum TaxID=219896 RepID=UPI0024BA62B3|nr:leucine-rich repeat receptor protein kinase HPCA1-like [Syzygium oleosum]